MYKELGIYCLMILGVVFYRNAIAGNAQEYAVRAGIVTNFARFTTWPENQSNTINLCLIGNPDIEDAFTSLNGKAIGEKILQVRYLPRLNDLTACQLLYISELENNKLIFLLNEIKLLPILTLGEDDFFINNGGMVSIQLIDDRVSLSINIKVVKISKLNISSRVLKLATVIQ